MRTRHAEDIAQVELVAPEAIAQLCLAGSEAIATTYEAPSTSVVGNENEPANPGAQRPAVFIGTGKSSTARERGNRYFWRPEIQRSPAAGGIVRREAPRV
jgi:hypothetical protein